MDRLLLIHPYHPPDGQTGTYANADTVMDIEYFSHRYSRPDSVSDYISQALNMESSLEYDSLSCLSNLPGVEKPFSSGVTSVAKFQLKRVASGNGFS